MLTRRSWMRSAFAAAAAPALADVPPISRLKSRRAEARPIPNTERLARVERARRLMRENRFDAIALAGGSSLLYFSGIRWGVSERLFVMILPAEGDPFLSPLLLRRAGRSSRLPAGLFPRRAF